MPWSRVKTEYSIHPRLVVFPSFSWWRVDRWMGLQLPACHLHDRPQSDSSPWGLNGEVTLSHSHGCEFTHWWIESWRAVHRPAPSTRPNSLNHGLQVDLQTHWITAFKCISEFTRSPSPSASQTRSIKYIFKEGWRSYGDTVVTEVDGVTGSIYSADPGVDRHHLISISSYHSMKSHTLSFPTFGLTRSVRDFVYPRNCVDPHSWVVSSLLTSFLRSSSLR